MLHVIAGKSILIFDNSIIKTSRTSFKYIKYHFEYAEIIYIIRERNINIYSLKCYQNKHLYKNYSFILFKQ